MAGSAFRSASERHEVGRALASLLRDRVRGRGIEVDEFGFVELENAVREMGIEYPGTTLEQVLEIVEKDPQRRFEVREGKKIRARAGHTFAVEIPEPPVEPPPHLYHGTDSESAISILEGGLQRMGKGYVHLASTTARARMIAKRHSGSPTILRISALLAWRVGIRFWRSGQVSDDGEIYLSDPIPPQFVEVICND